MLAFTPPGATCGRSLGQGLHAGAEHARRWLQTQAASLTCGRTSPMRCSCSMKMSLKMGSCPTCGSSGPATQGTNDNGEGGGGQDSWQRPATPAGPKGDEPAQSGRQKSRRGARVEKQLAAGAKVAICTAAGCRDPASHPAAGSRGRKLGLGWGWAGLGWAGGAHRWTLAWAPCTR